MTTELELKLVEKYPAILRDYRGDKMKTCMHWGMECGDGWYDLLDDLLHKLDFISKHSGVQVVANQIKEKFGTLRFYYSTIKKDDLNADSIIKSTLLGPLRFYYSAIKKGEFNVDPIVDKIIDDIVSCAERKSAYTCEETGKRGALCSRGGWLITLSKEEAFKNQYRPVDQDVIDEWNES